jgi:single-strand DNA-binding protein
MFDTQLTAIGRIITAPTLRRVGDQEVVRFRLASNSRRRATDGSWEPGNSLYLTVNCWGRLAIGVVSSLSKGDAVVVVGTVHTSEYEDREGARRSSLEMRATAVGPDLARYIATIKKVEEVAAPDGAAEVRTVCDDDGETAVERIDGGGPLPLSA